METGYIFFIFWICFIYDSQTIYDFWLRTIFLFRPGLCEGYFRSAADQSGGESETPTQSCTIEDATASSWFSWSSDCESSTEFPEARSNS